MYLLQMTPLHLAAKDGHIDVVELLLDKGAKILQDKNHLNYFDHAIDNGHTELVKIIINSKYWRSALRSTRRKADGSIDTPMRKLIRQMPKMARLACDKCIEKTTKGETESETHRYEFLDDTYSAEGWAAGFSAYDNNDMLKRDAEPYTNSFFIRKKNHPLNVMLECDRQELFKHPVVKSLMTSKWHGIYRALYMSSLLMYCVFLAALTGFLIAAEHPQSANFTLRAESHCISQDLSSTTLEEIAAYVVMVLSVANLVIEEWQWQVGAVSIFFGWINLVLYVQQMVPLIGIYVVMFTHTLITFAKFFIVAIIYTLAFGLAFYTVLHQEGSFEDVPKSLIKTWAMMIGELDFSDIFNDDMNKPAFPVLAYILFVVFMIIMSILIMNLLVGLAVGDIQAVQNTAARTRLETEVELILDVEILTPKFLLPKTVSRCKEISYAPTGCRQWFKRCWNRAKPMVVPSSAYVKPPETRDEISIEERLDEMSDMIRSLMKANKIDTTEKKAI
ncbi:hypothetical protein BaRGS_00032128 [Batillaria attramentaria]|uniref:Ion transport domain-containing protein n=1 Tax=Batillaria attramentaria TaxID=370345 RepID=A0ABD0JPN6_9CAEN